MSAGFILGSLWAEDASAWKVHRLYQRPYLQIEAIQQNYGFATIKQNRESFELRSPTALVQGRVAEKTILVNRLHYDLHFPPEMKNGRRLLSAYDLTNLLDLLLRPGSHMRPKRLKRVYLQAVEDEWSTRP